jgi:hypothetical protein
MSSDEDQRRLQAYGEVDAPPVEEAPAACDRCGEELDDEDDDLPFSAGRAEGVTGFVDIHEYGDDPKLCERCDDLVRYLSHRHAQLTDRSDVSGAVAVYCRCHGDDEVDIQPLSPGEESLDVACSACGSREVVVERLPPDHNTWRVDQ